MMPFGVLPDEVYRSIVKVGLEAAGYEARRADSSLDQRSILRDIVEGIQSADLLVADLTGRNANVFYELGLAHGLRKDVVLLAQSTSDIPFDLGAYRTLIYGKPEFKRPPSLVDRLSSELGQVLAAAKAGELEFGTPLSDFGVATESAAEGDEDEGPGYLDSLSDFIGAAEAFGEVMGRFGELTSELTSRQLAIGEGLPPPERRDIKEGLLFAARLAELWDESAGPMELLVEQELVPLQVRLERGMRASVALGGLGGGENTVLPTVLGVGKSAAESAAVYENTEALIRNLRSVSSSLRRPADRLAGVLQRVSGLMRRTEAVAAEYASGDATSTASGA
jgi:hypothetical protein